MSLAHGLPGLVVRAPLSSSLKADGNRPEPATGNVSGGPLQSRYSGPLARDGPFVRLCLLGREYAARANGTRSRPRCRRAAAAWTRLWKAFGSRHPSSCQNRNTDPWRWFVAGDYGGNAAVQRLSAASASKPTGRRISSRSRLAALFTAVVAASSWL